MIRIGVSDTATDAPLPTALDKLVFKEMIDDSDLLEYMESVRHQIDALDLEVLNLLAKRMKLSEEIGKHKKHNRISILQMKRWNEILEKAKDMGRERGLSEGFISHYLSAVHQESIARQSRANDDEGA